MKDFFLKYYRPRGFFVESNPTQFYLLQAVTFFYLAYRLASRDYMVYGLLDNSFIEFERPYVNNLVYPISYISTLQFIFDIVGMPTVEVLTVSQHAVLFASVLGLVGVYPRVMARIGCIFAIVITGFVLSTNAETDGGTPLIAALFVLSVTPSSSFYQLFGVSRRPSGSVHWHWPVTLFMLIMAAYYGAAGLNKVIDIGPHWPFVVRLDNLAEYCIAIGVFESSRYTLPAVCVYGESYTGSIFQGAITLVAELGFGLALLFPILSGVFVGIMIAFHLAVLFMAGINFTGTSILLLACVEYSYYRRLLMKRGAKSAVETGCDSSLHGRALRRNT